MKAKVEKTCKDILVYDANPARLKDVIRHLEKKGYECHMENTLECCLESLAARRFKYILIGRPGSDRDTLEVMRGAVNSGVELLPFDLFEHTNKEQLTKRMMRHLDDVLR